jgi:hypothetical protein
MILDDDHDDRADREYHARRSVQEYEAAEKATAEAKPIHIELAERHAERACLVPKRGQAGLH